MIGWAGGVDAESANEALAEETGTEVSAPRLPADVNNLDDVEQLPWALAAFLAVIGALAAVHALVSTVRLRRQDLAVLRALGFRRRQLAATLSWQATTIAVIGLGVGIPLGLAAGRLVWGAVARGIGVVDHPVMPALAIAVVVVAALVVTNLAAVLPGRSAARVRVAAVLRAA
jgi:ABC-type lipoprotein release transport system permease subunit